MNKDELLAKFQRLGKVLMTPVLILPIAGILQGFGNAFTSPTLTAAVPWLAAPGCAILFSILKAAAGIVSPMASPSPRRLPRRFVAFWATCA